MREMIMSNYLHPDESNRGTFYQATVSQLRHKGNLSKVSRDLEMSYDFLVRLEKGKVANPDVTKMEQLFEHLTGVKL